MNNKPFIHDNFLLQSKQARELYHDYAKQMPIMDYHCHLPIKEIANNKQWQNISQIWLNGDHYKWRQMRTNGIAEKYCTGDVSDREKFDKWAETMPKLLRNPLYHWSHLELARYFDINDRLLNPQTADYIWQTTSQKLQQPNMNARTLMLQSNVKLVCTTDDPTDDLKHHKTIAQDSTFAIKVLPTWRPDNAMKVEDPQQFRQWLNKLAKANNCEIYNFSTFLEALIQRHQYFHNHGCRLSDHGIPTVFAQKYNQNEINSIFDKVYNGKTPTKEDSLKFQSCMLYELCLMNHHQGWTQQIHYGVLRNNNSRMFKQVGADTGFDSIADAKIGTALSALLNRLDLQQKLSKTIIYNLNPRDNALLVTMLGNFQDGIIPGKMQHGSAWWVLDNKQGMEQQIETLSQMGMLSQFVGMLTDSRSFLSYTRHEYFRRILCNILGNDMQQGLIPQDMKLVGSMIQDICYNNAKKYFNFSK